MHFKNNSRLNKKKKKIDPKKDAVYIVLFIWVKVGLNTNKKNGTFVNTENFYLPSKKLPISFQHFCFLRQVCLHCQQCFIRVI